MQICLTTKIEYIITENIDKVLVDEEAYVSERISALNVPLISLDPSISAMEDEVEIDHFSNVSVIIMQKQIYEN